MDRETFAIKLKNGRIASGLTQKNVADILNRPQQTIGAWEVGRSQPDMETLSKLLQLYHIFANDFFDFNEEFDFKITLEEEKHIKKYRALDHYGKNAVNAILDCENERCMQSDTSISVGQLSESSDNFSREDSSGSKLAIVAMGGDGVKFIKTTKEADEEVKRILKEMWDEEENKQ